MNLPLPWLDDEYSPLPSPALALGADSPAPGLLAAGGRLTPKRLREAYRNGIFPWYSQDQPVLWWAPDPRLVLPVTEFRLHRSLRKKLQRFLDTPTCEMRIDSACTTVIHACASVSRDGQDGTWIVPAMQHAYGAWHAAGCVHSFETWIDGELVGGLYGVGLGRMFFGESMFSTRTDASKIALAALICFCRIHQIRLVDCQQNTAHLASLGAREIARTDFLRHLAATVDAEPVRDWIYDESMWAQLGLRPTTRGSP
ncbi:leucyl/phenylalanyl-tRNA--protein transferase [Azohydromonas caseinilytica]|uniref:Leucyl/phenylalanyl-tRNA--protein transferase n=1 Tax=Azohydromonas caseinilytica TaxID=2728836 RepID=A0A848F2Y2_9BURK|nr:leucyl/phenylalanyl-tRNA--protein transferase [Azohydromonas caseinilytica]NML14417.1 leucyl/phenylalanyl-tRNA--protein transferase [Azohydromonas caseinilytica]